MRDVQKKRERLAVAKWQAVKRMVYVAGSVTLGALAIDQGPRAVGQMAEFFDDFSILFYAGPLAEITITNNIADESAPTPWFTEDWDYTSSSNMHSDPNGWLFYTGSGTESNEMRLGTDGSAPFGGSGNYLEYDFTSSVANNGYDITFPDAGTDQPREIWQEQWIWFSSDFETANGGGGSPDYKMSGWYADPDAGPERTGFKIGQGGSGRNTQASLDASAFMGGGSNDCNAATNRIVELDPPTKYWLGEWIRQRIYIQYDRTPGTADTGAMRINVASPTITGGFSSDSTIVFCSELGSGQFEAGKYVNKTYLGRNMNQPPAAADTFTVRRGPVYVYTEDPGWVFDSISS